MSSSQRSSVRNPPALRRSAAGKSGWLVWISKVSALVSRTLAGNARFARFWAEGAVSRHAEDQKRIRHPEVGEIIVDCDVLTDGETDLKVIAYTATPGSESERKLRMVASPSSEPKAAAGI